MRNLLTLIIIGAAGAGLLAGTAAEAARLGSGKSIGMQRQSIPREAPKAPTAQPAPAAPAGAVTAPTAQPPKPAGASRWLAPLIGFGLGAAMMSMFGGGPLMGAIGNMLMFAVLAGAVFFAINFFRRKAAPADASPIQYAGVPTSLTAAATTAPSSPSPSASQGLPPGFDSDGFLRQAKISFIRLQAANDAKDLRDIRDYTTPELYAELAMQIQERGDASQKTDVVTLNAELLDVTNEPDRAIASVRFTGLIREVEASGAAPVDEIWHVVKDLKDGKAAWLIAGIEQNI